MDKHGNFISDIDCECVKKLVLICGFEMDYSFSCFRVPLSKKKVIVTLWPMDGIATFYGKTMRTFRTFKELLAELLKEKVITKKQMDRAMKSEAGQ